MGAGQEGDIGGTTYGVRSEQQSGYCDYQRNVWEDSKKGGSTISLELKEGMFLKMNSLKAIQEGLCLGEDIKIRMKKKKIGNCITYFLN